MVDEIIGVGHAVLLNVRTVRIGRVGPPVVALGIKIVFSSGASVADEVGDGNRFFNKNLISPGNNFDFSNRIVCFSILLPGLIPWELSDNSGNKIKLIKRLNFIRISAEENTIYCVYYYTLYAVMLVELIEAV